MQHSGLVARARLKLIEMLSATQSTAGFDYLTTTSLTENRIMVQIF